MNRFAAIALIVFALTVGPAVHGESKLDALSVAEFLPTGFATDGSVNYQVEIQKAIDAAARDGRALIFPPMIYRLDENGVEIHSRMTLILYGAVFQIDEKCVKDGQAFIGRDVSSVRFLGGEIVGRNDVWALGVNIRGMHLSGACRDIHIEGMRIRDLTSNGIGLFADEKNPARDVWVTDCVVENACNWYGDYLSEKPGPEKGSVRLDQGLIAFYHVHDFVVRGCRFEKSRSDGTHFFKCKQGQFVHNKVYAAQMGGYFLETCTGVLAADNVIRDNGSRGVTIERGSSACTLRGNVVANSGREGLWAPDCTGLIITGNIFDRNGRKPNGTIARHLWNANITVNEDPFDPTNSPVADYLIQGNILYTNDSQHAAMRIDATMATGIVVKDNVLRGENRKILVEGDAPGTVELRGND